MTPLHSLLKIPGRRAGALFTLTDPVFQRAMAPGRGPQRLLVPSLSQACRHLLWDPTWRQLECEVAQFSGSGEKLLKLGGSDQTSKVMT